MASPIAHSFAGISIYWIFRQMHGLPWNRKSVRSTITGAAVACFLANVSDLDLLAGMVSGRYLHHQVTHTFFFALFMGILAAMVGPLVSVRRFRAFYLTFLLVASHIVIDYFTRDTSVPKGCMVFWPITDRYYIFPIPVFIDIWRMTPKLTFGFNNLNAAIRESAVGFFFLLIAFSIRPFPIPVRKWLILLTVSITAISFVAHRPLKEQAEQQLAEYLGNHPGTAIRIQSTDSSPGIVFSSRKSGNSDIFCIQPDGTGLKQLTINPAEDTWPSWSPDAAWIAYQSDRSGNMDIWIMSPDGMTNRNLTERSPFVDETPSWTAGSNQIVFCSHRDGKPELMVMNLDGSGMKKISSREPGKVLMPAVSPVADIVAYTGDDPPFPGWNIYTLSLNGGRAEKVSPEFGCRGNWSPDGKFLVYVSGSATDASELYIFKASGGPRRRITHSSDYDYDPCFSPDGSKICFSRGNDGVKGKWDLWILDLETSEENRLTHDGLDNRNPSWR